MIDINIDAELLLSQGKAIRTMPRKRFGHISNEFPTCFDTCPKYLCKRRILKPQDGWKVSGKNYLGNLPSLIHALRAAVPVSKH